MKKLFRSRNSVFGGVCSGIAEYMSQSTDTADEDTIMLYEIDPTWIRLSWIMLALFGGIGIITYLLCWVIIPKKPLQV